MKCIEDEIPFDLPVGWAWCRLALIGTTNIGLTYSPSDICDNGVMVLRSSNIIDGKIDLTDLVRVNTPIRDNQYMVTNDILLCARNGSKRLVGKCAILENVNEPVSFGAFMAIYRSEFNRFIYHFFNTETFRSTFISDDSKQINQLTQDILKRTLLPLPPISEQNRIVSRLSVVIPIIETIESKQEDLQQLIVSTKSKILDLAIRGQLVSQDPNDEPASVLLDRIRTEKEALIKSGKIKRDKKESVIFKGEDNSYYDSIPSNWAVTSLSELTTPLSLNDGDWILSENMSPSGEVKLIQLGSVGYMNYVEKGFKYLSDQTFDELKCTQIFSGYMLINRIISDKMCACILPQIEGKLITTVDTCWIAPDDGHYNLRFLLYAVSAPSFQALVMLNSAGTTRKRISKNNLIHLPIFCPPLKEQYRIVDAIEKAFNQLDSIINAIE